MNRPIRVLIVDDSALVRQALTEMLTNVAGIEIMGAASDPYVAAQRISEEKPDVIILDIEMPRMDGLTFLRTIMTQHPIPVIICSSLATEGSRPAIEALENGALEVLAKPKLGTRQFFEESKIQFIEAIRGAAAARLRPISARHTVEPKLSADAILSRPHGEVMETTDKVVVMGASTGGTEALRVVLEALPAHSPGIVIVQHMPEKFTRSFAERLNQSCRLEVKEAQNYDSVVPGRALIAPGNRHLLLQRSGAKYHVVVKDGPLVCRHRPSVDVLFRSAARYAGKNSLGVLLTGMGDDGAKGLLEMKQTGAMTIAQDEATSVVYGMPHEAVKLGAATTVLPLPAIAGEILRFASN